MKPVKNAYESPFIGQSIDEGIILGESLCNHYGKCIVEGQEGGCRTNGLWLHIDKDTFCWTNLRESSKRILGLGDY